MWGTCLIGIHCQLDEVTPVPSYEGTLFGCGKFKLLPIIETSSAYLMNTNDIKTETSVVAPILPLRAVI